MSNKRGVGHLINVGQKGYRTNYYIDSTVSDKRGVGQKGVGQKGCRTKGCRTKGVSDKRGVGQKGCLITGCRTKKVVPFKYYHC